MTESWELYRYINQQTYLIWYPTILGEAAEFDSQDSMEDLDKYGFSDSEQELIRHCEINNRLFYTEENDEILRLMEEDRLPLLIAINIAVEDESNQDWIVPEVPESWYTD